MSELLLFGDTVSAVEAAFEAKKPDARRKASQILAQYLRDATSSVVPVDKRDEAAVKAEAIQAIIHRHRHTNLKSVDHGGTPEAAIKPHSTEVVTRLIKDGHLNHSHEWAARDIAECYRLASSAVWAKTMRFDKQPTSNSSPMIERLALQHAAVYLPWARDIPNTERWKIELVLDVVVWGHAIYYVSSHHRIGRKKALAALSEQLVRYLNINEARGEL